MSLDLYGKIIDIANDWAQKWYDSIEEQKNDRKNFYASIIATSGMLVISMRTLSESWINIGDNIADLRTKREETKYEDAVKKLRSFSRHEKILPMIRHTHSQLAQLANMNDVLHPDFRIQTNKHNPLSKDKEDKKKGKSSIKLAIEKVFTRDKQFDLKNSEIDAIQEIIVCANEFRLNVLDLKSPVTPYFSQEMLEKHAQDIISGEEKKIEKVHISLVLIGDNIKKNFIARAEGAKGSLNGSLIKREHLPDPLWSIYENVLQKAMRDNDHGGSI